MSIFAVFVLAVVASFAIVGTRATEGICWSYHNDVGWMLGGHSWSTAMLRTERGYFCHQGPEPCQVYVTMGDTADMIYVNFHISEAQCGDWCFPTLRVWDDMAMKGIKVDS